MLSEPILHGAHLAAVSPSRPAVLTPCLTPACSLPCASLPTLAERWVSFPSAAIVGPKSNACVRRNGARAAASDGVGEAVCVAGEQTHRRTEANKI